MKRIICVALFCMMLFGCTGIAEILPPDGIHSSFYEFTGIETMPAVILCESLTVYDDREGRGKAVVTLLGAEGKKLLPVIDNWDGWAQIYYNDGNSIGWVRSDYLMFDPFYYLTHQGTAVYAYPEHLSPKIAYLEKGEKLPIIKDNGDWVLVSIRNAAGWIKKTPQDDPPEISPEDFRNIEWASITLDGDETVYETYDFDKLKTLSELLTNCEDTGGMMAGCPFTATLEIRYRNENGTSVQLSMKAATDSCCVIRLNDRDFKYARHLVDPDKGNPSNELLFDLFGVTLRY